MCAYGQKQNKGKNLKQNHHHHHRSTDQRKKISFFLKMKMTFISTQINHSPTHTHTHNVDKLECHYTHKHNDLMSICFLFIFLGIFFLFILFYLFCTICNLLFHMMIIVIHIEKYAIIIILCMFEIFKYQTGTKNFCFFLFFGGNYKSSLYLGWWWFPIYSKKICCLFPSKKNLLPIHLHFIQIFWFDLNKFFYFFSEPIRFRLWINE